MASFNFTNLTRHYANGAVKFDGSQTFKVLLVSSVPTTTETTGNQDAWVNRSDVTGEVTGTGYTAGGVAVTVTVGTVDTTNNRTPVTFTNLAPGWTTSTITAVAAIIYKSTGTAATDKLICMIDFGGTVSSTAGNYNVTFATPLYINR